MEDTMQMKPARKWQGKASAEICGPKAEQVWLFLQDFFGLNKWLPTLTTCLPIEGTSGMPGCIRYCAGFKTPFDKPNDDTDKKDNNGGSSAMNWSKQKLLWINPRDKTFSYSIVDGNVGFNNFVSVMKVVPKEDGRCCIEWEYEVDPVEGWTLDDLNQYIGSNLETMAKKMEEVVAMASMNGYN